MKDASVQGFDVSRAGLLSGANVIVAPFVGAGRFSRSPPKMKRKLLYRFLWIILASSGFAIIITTWLSQCPGEVEINLGNFTSHDLGNRASIQRLSSEIRRCPEAHSYTVHWYVIASNKIVAARATIYLPSSKAGDENMVGYETDVGSGLAYVVSIADDSPIHEVALKHGTFTDFKKYAVTRKGNKPR